MLPEWTVVGFTGHRKLENPEAVRQGIRAALKQLAESHSPLASVSSIASGGDTLFVEEVAAGEIPFSLLLPFDASRFKHDFSDEEWNHVQPLFLKAKKTEVVKTLHDDRDKEEAYLETGLLTVNRADVIIAVWDGLPAKGPAGTANIVRYAQSLSKPVIIVNPTTGTLSEIRLPPKLGSNASDGNHYDAILRHLDTFDAKAEKHAFWSRNFFRIVIVTHLLASAVAITPLVFGTHTLQPAIWKFVLLLLAVGIVLCHHWSHHTWIHNRVEAELYRSILSLWNFRRSENPFPHVEIPGLEKKYRNLQILWYSEKNAQSDYNSARTDYLKNRIKDQSRYYDRSQKEAYFRFRTCKTLAYVSSVVALVCAFIVIFNHEYHVAKFLSILLPLASAGLLSLAVSNDLIRRTTRYKEMHERLESLATQLEAMPEENWAGFARIVRETEQILLQELTEWYSAARVAGASH